MAAGVNMGGGQRMFYAVAGVGLMAWGFFGLEGGWTRIAVPILGAIALLEGLIGF